MPAAIKFSPEQESRICQLYSDGYSSHKISLIENVGPKLVIKIARKHNLHIRDYSEINRKYDVDHSYFDNIDREDKAYFLGFLFADGHVSSSSTSFRTTIKLNRKDRPILELFSNFLYRKNLVKDAPQDCCYLEFSSKQIRSKLIFYGCTPKKSLTLKFPDVLPKEMIHHFMRGYFDGDGSATLYKNKLGNLEGKAVITSTKEFCQKYKEIIKEELQIDCNYYSDSRILNSGNKITVNLNISGNLKFVSFYRFLYKDATIFLARKKEKFEIIKKETLRRNPELKSKKINFSEEQIKEIFSLYISGICVQDISKKYNCSSSYIYKTLRKNNI